MRAIAANPPLDTCAGVADARRAGAGEHTSASYSWIFFAAEAKPTSMRRAVAERLAGSEPVVVVDLPLSLARERSAPPLAARVSRSAGCLRYRPLHLPEKVPLAGPAMKAWNRCRLARELRRLLPPGLPRIVCYDSPVQEYLAGTLGDCTSVYVAVDDRTLTVRGEPIAGELAAERRLLRKVDRVVCVSERLAAVLRERAGTDDLPIVVLSNGYDERLFDPSMTADEPPGLAAIPRPRVLVSGHVSDRIDWDGIAAAVNERPEWTWVFVGPADPGVTARLQDIAARLSPPRSRLPGPPLVWLGQVGVESIPAFIAHCDAGAVPYRLNAFTAASSPLKAIECLAMRTPVIATKIPSLLRWGTAVRWVDQGDGRSYATALDCCTRAGAPAVDLSGESWAARAAQFREAVVRL